MIWKAGSSPLTRGGLYCDIQLCAEHGLIPAYAGRTPTTAAGLQPAWAHPRLRGADALQRAGHGYPSGSSPLTRGGQRLAVVCTASSGLIPAYAGRT